MDWSPAKSIAEQKSNTSGFKLQNHPFKFFNEMVSVIKTKNKTLDAIRS